jgi:hypothetical protein
MKQFYRQCTMTKGTISQMAWIPEHFAVLDKYLRLKKDGVDEDGWQVKSVGANRIDGEYLKEHERNYLSQRKASDI